MRYMIIANMGLALSVMAALGKTIWYGKTIWF